MRIAVIGAGAIGGLVAAYLKQAGEAVSLVARPEAARVIRDNGLQVSGCRGELQIKIGVAEKLSAVADLIILATKTQDLGAALKDNREFLDGAQVLTTQNGIQADYLASRYIPKEKIISSIVMFGATSLQPGKIVHNFEGPWVIGKMFAPNGAALIKVNETLNKIFPALLSEDIKGMKYLKVFVNANNCLPAILGQSMQEAFADAGVGRIAMAVWREGLAVVRKSGASLASLPDFPLERLEKLTALPLEEAAKIYCGIMTNLSKEPLYGSILQSIKRGRPSEIDYLNGEFVRLAKDNQTEAPLNEKLVEMVHLVEKTGKFFSKKRLISETNGLLMSNDKAKNSK
jgi:2-dehydropantoate 2-reductase